MIRLPEFFKEHMMFQRDKEIFIWGHADNQLEITIELGDIKQTVIVENEKFCCIFPKKEACTNQTLVFYSGKEKRKEIEIKDISFGDIWIAAGQSNMEYFLRYDAHWNDIKKLEPNKNIRMYNCPRKAFKDHQRDFSDSGYWFLEGDSAFESFSAPGYAFARELQTKINVPIGIIGCNWGGTPACAWVDKAYLKEELMIYLEEYEAELKGKSLESIKKESLSAWKEEDSFLYQMAFRAVMYGINETDQKKWVTYFKDKKTIPMGPYHKDRPGGLYEEMVKKIAPFPVKGVLWYQGESDSCHATLYDKMLDAVIRCFRETWKDELSFLLVQLAPFEKWLECTGEQYEEVRKKQEMAALSHSNVFMTSIMDLGMREDIHPKEKFEVGKRLALLARGKVYGEDILCESPMFRSAEMEENVIILKFENTGEKLHVIGNQINAMEIFLDGRKKEILDFIISDELKLTIDMKDESFYHIDILFAEMSFCEVNLFNEVNLPMKPFRCAIEKG